MVLATPAKRQKGARFAIREVEFAYGPRITNYHRGRPDASRGGASAPRRDHLLGGALAVIRVWYGHGMCQQEKQSPRATVVIIISQRASVVIID